MLLFFIHSLLVKSSFPGSENPLCRPFGPHAYAPVSTHSRSEDFVEMELSVFSLLDHPYLGHDAINQRMACHVERRIPRAREIGRDGDFLNIASDPQATVLQSLDGTAFHRRYFRGWAFLNRDVRAGSRAQIDGGPWRRDDEFDIVDVCQTCQSVRADFVGGVPVRDHPVGSDDDAGNVLGFPFEAEERSGHGVCDESCGDLVMKELVPCQARSLVVGSRFRVIDPFEIFTSVKASYDTQSGTVACSCQGA